jgi:Holliday junction resolvasome RuvABC endonuclease subunit
MRAIGFRAEAATIHWAVVEGTSDEPVLVEHGNIAAAAALGDESRCLSHLRDRVLETIESFGPDVAAVRYPEVVRKSNSVSGDARIRVEGVILEACASQNLKTFTGMSKSMSARLGTKTVKGYLTSDNVRGLQWPMKKQNCRESIMVAISALEK